MEKKHGMNAFDFYSLNLHCWDIFTRTESIEWKSVYELE